MGNVISYFMCIQWCICRYIYIYTSLSSMYHLYGFTFITIYIFFIAECNYALWRHLVTNVSQVYIFTIKLMVSFFVELVNFIQKDNIIYILSMSKNECLYQILWKSIQNH